MRGPPALRVLLGGGGAHRGAAAAACGAGCGIPWGACLGHGEGRQAPGLTLGTVAPQLRGPRLAWGKDGLAIGRGLIKVLASCRAFQNREKEVTRGEWGRLP